jgi:hypothetical protein
MKRQVKGQNQRDISKAQAASPQIRAGRNSQQKHGRRVRLN